MCIRDQTGHYYQGKLRDSEQAKTLSEVYERPSEVILVSFYLLKAFVSYFKPHFGDFETAH